MASSGGIARQIDAIRALQNLLGNSMKPCHALLLAVIFAATPAAAQQTDQRFDPKLSDRENIKALRAKALADEAKEDTARPWDKERAAKRAGKVEAGASPK